MPVAQGIAKQLSYKKQLALGTAAAGAGGQILRRETSTFTAPADSYENAELASHQQSTGVTLGVIKPAGQINGVLSPGTYAALIASLLRKDLTAGVSAAGASLTIAANGQNWNITRAAGSYLADGFKIGDVVRLTAGTFNVLNSQKNVQIIAIPSATVITVKVVNGTNMFAEGPIATATIAVTGKKSLAPLANHTNDYYSFEEWYSDLGRSELFPDSQIAQAQFNLPATGNATVQIDTVGRIRTRGAARVLTTPAAETTTDPLAAVNGLVLINGVAVANITGAQLTVNGNTTHSEAVVGSNIVDDMQRGRIAVSGQFTAKFDGVTLQDAYDARSAISLILCITEDATANADFVVLSMGAVTLTGDAPDDGEKAIVRTYPFTAKLNAAGGAALANDQTILSYQDSAA